MVSAISAAASVSVGGTSGGEVGKILRQITATQKQITATQELVAKTPDKEARKLLAQQVDSLMAQLAMLQAQLQAIQALAVQKAAEQSDLSTVAQASHRTNAAGVPIGGMLNAEA